jgi:hypothetical protein
LLDLTLEVSIEGGHEWRGHRHYCLHGFPPHETRKGSWGVELAIRLYYVCMYSPHWLQWISLGVNTYWKKKKKKFIHIHSPLFLLLFSYDTDFRFSVTLSYLTLHLTSPLLCEVFKVWPQQLAIYNNMSFSSYNIKLATGHPPPKQLACVRSDYSDRVC